MAVVDAERLVLLTPIEPAATGNGLAMRAELFRRAAPAGMEVLTVVVPVAGSSPAAPAGGAIVVAADPGRARAGILGLAAGDAWSERFARAGKLPAPARVASPGLVDEVVAAIGSGGSAALHVVRAYMAPLGAAVSERLGASWATLDLDEDDATFARSCGDLEGAAAYERLLAVFAPLFDGLSAASAREAAAIGERHALAVSELPNAVGVGDPLAPRPARALPGGRARLLFVGNLTYAPNREAAHILVERILPPLRQRLGRPVTVVLAGPHGGRLDHLRGEDVELTGFVPELGPLYASASLVVVPLRAGAGTRIKLLEAFAHAVPVVASSVAAAGLEVVDGRHLLIADEPGQAVGAIESILTGAEPAQRMVDAAGRLVRERYSFEAVAPAIRAFFDRAARGGGSARG